MTSPCFSVVRPHRVPRISIEKNLQDCTNDYSSAQLKQSPRWSVQSRIFKDPVLSARSSVGKPQWALSRVWQERQQQLLAKAWLCQLRNLSSVHSSGTQQRGDLTWRRWWLRWLWSAATNSLCLRSFDLTYKLLCGHSFHSFLCV